jgi:hypothetical protein
LVVKKQEALKELRSLVSTYLEGSEDAGHAAKLLAVLEEPEPAASSGIPKDIARKMFGCTVESIDEMLAGKEPRDIALYAMGTLSNAQEYIRCDYDDGPGGWRVASVHANTIRQLINVAKYAINKAVTR